MTATTTPAGNCAHHHVADCTICNAPGRCDWAGCIADATLQHVRRFAGRVTELRLACHLHGATMVDAAGGKGRLIAVGVEVPEVLPPEHYCPTCARARGNDHHADECVCAGTYVDRVPDGLLPPTVRVAGGQVAALANLARVGGYPYGNCVIPQRDLNDTLQALVERGPKVPVRVTVERSDRGWRIEAQPGSGQLALEGVPHPFVATLPACDCDRTPCTRPGCREYGHCHGLTYSGRHAAHVEAFVRKVARTYPGRVTVGPIPR